MTKTVTHRGDYGWPHQRIRAQINEQVVLAGRAACVRCGEPILPGEPWDLGHVDGDPSRYAGPEHRRCNRGTSGRARFQQYTAVVEDEPEPEGLGARDDRWAVPWLKGLRRPPAGAVWPRLMSVPHYRAAGSLGREFVRWSEKRAGRELRWWQRLAATRILEHDDQERLVWDEVLLTVARQCGKSWLLRELFLWRIHQGDRFGEPQDVMHTGKDLAVCKEVQRPARIWAKARPAYKVREVNGQEEIELLEDGSRWMLRAKEAVYGYSASLAGVDEAWKVKLSTVDEGLTPTMVERVQAQLLLVSTAHRLATALMVGRRKVALGQLEAGDGLLLVEWSAPRGIELDDVDGWRLASPFWTPQRQRLISQRFEAMRTGELEDPEEPDPEESFRAQWLNQWPRLVTIPTDKTEPLLPAELWQQLTVPGMGVSGPLWVAVEDDFGLGAAVAAAARLPDGRLELGGWLCPDWDTAISEAAALGEHYRVRQLLVGASLLNRVPPGTSPPPRPAGGTETRAGLALIRDLVANGQVIHDTDTRDLDEALTVAHVRELPTGLQLAARGPTHLVRAAVWALSAAHRPIPTPRIG